MGEEREERRRLGLWDKKKTYLISYKSAYTIYIVLDEASLFNQQKMRWNSAVRTENPIGGVLPLLGTNLFADHFKMEQCFFCCFSFIITTTNKNKIAHSLFTKRFYREAAHQNFNVLSVRTGLVKWFC